MKRVPIFLFVIWLFLAFTASAQQGSKRLQSRKLTQRAQRSKQPAGSPPQQEASQSAFAIQKPVEQPAIMLEEKFRLWKGQKVIILPYEDDKDSYVSSIPKYSQVRRYVESEGFGPINRVSEAEFFKPYTEYRLSRKDYAGRTGAIIDVRHRVYKGWQGSDWEVNEFLIGLDPTGEKIVALEALHYDNIVGFVAEMEIAKSYVGKSFGTGLTILYLKKVI